MRLIRTAIFVLLMVSALPAAKTLDMYVIDVEGSKAFLLVSPSGQSMLIDAGIPENEKTGWAPRREPHRGRLPGRRR